MDGERKKITPQNFYCSISTTGFFENQLPLLPAFVDYCNALLVDIRLNTASKSLIRTKDYLSLLLKDRYRHVPLLGERTLGEGRKPQIQNLELGIKTILNFNTNLILMCACGKTEGCHRFTISDALNKKGIHTEEIADWNLPNLIL